MWPPGPESTSVRDRDTARHAHAVGAKLPTAPAGAPEENTTETFQSVDLGNTSARFTAGEVLVWFELHEDLIATLGLTR